MLIRTYFFYWQNCFRRGSRLLNLLDHYQLCKSFYKLIDLTSSFCKAMKREILCWNIFWFTICLHLSVYFLQNWSLISLKAVLEQITVSGEIEAIISVKSWKYTLEVWMGSNTLDHSHLFLGECRWAGVNKVHRSIE